MHKTFSEKKSSIIERFNRTINEKLKVQFEINKNKNWVDIIDIFYMNIILKINIEQLE